MVNKFEPLPLHKNIFIYFISFDLLGVFLIIVSILKTEILSTFMLFSLLFTFLVFAITFYMWETRCPNCNRVLVRSEKKEWQENLGIKKEPYTYYSEMYKFEDGSVEPVLNSKKTILRSKQYNKDYFICKNCEYGIDKEWSKINSKWIGKKPRIKYINKKYHKQSKNNLFRDEIYTYKKKRKRIPAAVKNDLWVDNFGKEYFGNCFVCEKSIDTKNFEAGHIQSVAEGGSDNKSNLKPLCSACNRSMGTMNLFKYKKIYYAKLKK